MINTNEILSKYGIRLTKSLGQNFLTDINVLRNIADAGDISKEDLVIEIGPGIGALTVQLAERAGKVIAIEIDKKLMDPLAETTGDFNNIEIVNQDVLKTDIPQLIGDWAGPVKIISNLPYYVTTPVIMMILENKVPCERMVLMIQKEVAKRMSAVPGNKDYGSLTVSVRYYAEPKLLFTVKPNCFVPKPDVDSAVILLKKREQPLVDVQDPKIYFRLIKAAFSQRRKTIVNSLSSNTGISSDKEKIREMLAACSISETIRAEALSPEQFAQLTDWWIENS